MCEELDNLAKEFAFHKGKSKWARYPEDLWERAIDFCNRYPVKVVAEALRVSVRTLCRRYSPHRNKTNKPPIIKLAKPPEFIPIQIEAQPSIQVHIDGPIRLSIEFNRSTEELAKFIFAVQGEVHC